MSGPTPKNKFISLTLDFRRRPRHSPIAECRQLTDNFGGEHWSLWRPNKKCQNANEGGTSRNGTAGGIMPLSGGGFPPFGKAGRSNNNNKSKRGQKNGCGKKENVCTEGTAGISGELRCLDRDYCWLGGGGTWHGGSRRPPERGELQSPALPDRRSAVHFQPSVSAPHRLAVKTNPIPSHSPPFAAQNFLSRRLKRTKSFPKLIRRERDGEQQRHNTASSPGERALSTDQRDLQSGAPLSLYLVPSPAAGPADQQQQFGAPPLRPCRSHESLPQNSVLRRLQPVHPSLCPDNCFELDQSVFACRSSGERSRWMNSIRRRMNPQRDRTHRVENALSVWVLEAKGVSPKRRFFCELSLDGQLRARTSTKGMGDGICFWGESFDFQSLPPTQHLCIDLFREPEPKRTRIRAAAKEQHTLVGLVHIPMADLVGRQPTEKWYAVSTGDANNNSTTDSQPSIRVKARYQCVHILPLNAYKPLREFLRSQFLPLCSAFEPILGVKAKEDFANSAVRILHHERRAAEALADLAMAEVEGQENDHLLFRGNSLATKAVEAYMKLVAADYLQRALGDFVRHVLTSDLACEVDPLRLTSHSASALERNRQQLTQQVELAWCRILASTEHFPHQLRVLFASLRRHLEESGRAELADNLLSSSIFLRFLCPAILSPSLFGLVSEYPTGTAARNLTLVAKSLQTLANFTRFGGKESYMEFMNGFVEREWRNMQCFLRKISAFAAPSPFDEARYSAVNAEIDLGKELSLLHSYLSEHWSPKVAEGAHMGELWEALVMVGIWRSDEEEDNGAEEEAYSISIHNPPSDYENNSVSASVRDTTDEHRARAPPPRRAVLPARPPLASAVSFSPASTTSHHLDSADDYVLSSALSQLQLIGNNCCSSAIHLYDETPVQPPHVYDEVAVEALGTAARRPVATVMSAPRVGAASLGAERRELCTPRVVQRALVEKERRTEESDSSGEKGSPRSDSYRQRRTARKKWSGSSIGSAEEAMTLQHEGSTFLEPGKQLNGGTTANGVHSSGYQSQMNSSSYSSNSSSPTDTEHSTSHPQHHHARPAMAIANPLYSSTSAHSSISDKQRGSPRERAQTTASPLLVNKEVHSPQFGVAKPRTNPSCWSIPCSSVQIQPRSTAVFVGPDPIDPSSSAFVRYPPPKFPLAADEGNNLRHWAPPSLQNGAIPQHLQSQLYSSASVDVLNDREPNRRCEANEQLELIEARRQIEELTRANAFMRRELDQLRASVSDQQITASETI